MSRGDELYERVKRLEEEWLESEVRKRITSAVSPSLLLAKEPVDALDQSNERRAAGEKFLAAMKAAWEDHQLCMGMITDVLMYMVCPSGFLQCRPLVGCLELTLFSCFVGSRYMYRSSKAFHIHSIHVPVPRLCPPRHRTPGVRDDRFRRPGVDSPFHDTAGESRTYHRETIDPALYVHAGRSL